MLLAGTLERLISDRYTLFSVIFSLGKLKYDVKKQRLKTQRKNVIQKL